MFVFTSDPRPLFQIDIHGVLRASCSNCTECPQFVSIPGHVLCAYCGCPPARHGKADPGGLLGDGAVGVPPLVPGGRKRGRERNISADSVGRGGRGVTDSEWETEQSDLGSDSEETSSGVSSYVSNTQPRRQRRRWRPSWQVTAPPPRVSRLLEGEPVGREEQLEHTWNDADTSPNIYVKPEDPLTFHRNPVYQTSDAIRGKAGGDGEGYTRGLHIWSVHWPSASRGTHPVVGMASR